MTHQSELIDTDIEAYLAQHEKKQLLRFLTCGSVDDGKSTLIGTLLIHSHNTFEDQLAAVQRDSKTHGTTGGGIDPALLTDGLKAEREQGITIDVAYRYFSTAKRKYIIADTPGHEQYTRNMATGASTADLAIILIDARSGVLTQTRRHSFITSLLGIRHILVAVNKMDLVDYSEETFEKIKEDFREFATRLDMGDVHFIPMSALEGDNVVHPSENMPWYDGSTLMHHLENVYIGSDRNLVDFRFPVQYVSRPDLNFRGFSGTVASGVVRKGDDILALPSQKTSKVDRIVTYDGDVEEAFASQAVTLTLADEIDISRGNMIVHPGNVPRLASKFEAMVVWMNDDALKTGKPYLFKQTTQLVSGSVSDLRYQIDVNSLHRIDEKKELQLNEIGRCTVTLSQPIAFDDYKKNRNTGAFIIVDRITNVTVGAGMIIDRTSGDSTLGHWDDEPVSEQLQEQFSSVTQAEREAQLGQQPTTLLLTGLTGAGKSTLAYALERRLFELGRVCAVLDGENMRMGISRDLGFTAEERSENLRRSAEVAKLMNDSGLIVISAFLAPSEGVRQRVRETIGEDNFLEVYLSAPVEVCRERDAEGMYRLADSGEIPNFPGVSAPYDAPQSPDLTLPTHELSVDQCVDRIVGLLTERGVITD